MLVSLSGDHFIKKNEHLQADERAQCGLHPSQVANFCNDAEGSKKRYAHLDFKEGMVSELIVGCTSRLQPTSAVKPKSTGAHKQNSLLIRNHIL